MKTLIRVVSLAVSLANLPLAWAGAPEPGAPAEELRVVGVILSAKQVLVWEELSGEYRLCKLGEALFGGRLAAIAPDHVLVDHDGVETRVDVQQAPSERLFRRPRRMAPVIVGIGPEPREAEPIGALAARATATEPKPAVVAEAPKPAVVAEAPKPAEAPAPVAPAPVIAPVVAAAPVVAPVASPVAAPAPPSDVPAMVQAGSDPTTLTPTPAPAHESSLRHPPHVARVARDVLERELSDFDRVASQVELAPDEGGGFRLLQLAPGSFFAQLGLRAGDVVRRVDNRSLSTVADAARAYALLRLSNYVTVDLERDGRPLTLRYAITRN